MCSTPFQTQALPDLLPFKFHTKGLDDVRTTTYIFPVTNLASETGSQRLRKTIPILPHIRIQTLAPPRSAFNVLAPCHRTWPPSPGGGGSAVGGRPGRPRRTAPTTRPTPLAAAAAAEAESPALPSPPSWSPSTRQRPATRRPPPR